MSASRARFRREFLPASLIGSGIAAILLIVTVNTGALVAQEPGGSSEAVAFRLVDSLERPVAGAVVEVLPTGRRFAIANDGRVDLELASGEAALLVEHPTFENRVLTRAELEAVAADDGLVRLAVAALDEELVVFAERPGRSVAPVSIAVTALRPREALVAPAANLAELATRAPGVSENGQGGLFGVVSIRGVSRHRVLTLLAGVPLSSERRAGVSGSFLDPNLTGQLDVFRGPASTHYGSGAIGGVLFQAPKVFDRLRLEAALESEGDLHALTAGWGSRNLSLGVARRASSDRQTADGIRRFDRFEQISSTVEWSHVNDRRRFRLLAVPSVGRNIGKPASDVPERTTIYPRERHLLLRGSIAFRDHTTARAWWHPSDLVTEVRTLDRSAVDRVENQTHDAGLGFEHSRTFSHRGEGDWQVLFGGEWSARRGVEAVESTLDDSSGMRLGPSTQTLRHGASDEIGSFVLVDGAFSHWRLETGLRATAIRQSNEPSSAVVAGSIPAATSDQREALSGFLGASVEVARGLVLKASAGTGFRSPTLSERFFTGTTGRGQVIGNPNLRPERSLELEAGFKHSGRRVVTTGYVWQTTIDDFIERIDTTPELRTFVNLVEGELRGAELDLLATLGNDLQLEASGHWIEGEAQNGLNLADLPPWRVQAGLRRRAASGSTSVVLRYRAERTADEVASGEQAIPDAWLLDLTWERQLSQRLALRLWGANLLDETWWSSSDDRALAAPGRTFGLGIRFAAH